MQRPVNHLSILEHFVSLFEPDRFCSSNKDIGHGSGSDGIADKNTLMENLLQPDSFGLAESSLLTKLFEQARARMPLRMKGSLQACVEAIIDSVYETHGLLKTSYELVASEYRSIFGELKVQELMEARDFLMHQGPVLGLACRSTHEFKWVIARHFVAGDFIRDDATQNRKLKDCFKALHNAGDDYLKRFAELAGAIYQNEKSPRRLGPTKVTRLLKCDSDAATFFAAVYSALPNTPLRNSA